MEALLIAIGGNIPPGRHLCKHCICFAYWNFRGKPLNKDLVPQTHPKGLRDGLMMVFLSSLYVCEVQQELQTSSFAVDAAEGSIQCFILSSR
jgi:hypothetical protein